MASGPVMAWSSRAVKTWLACWEVYPLDRVVHFAVLSFPGKTCLGFSDVKSRANIRWEGKVKLIVVIQVVVEEVDVRGGVRIQEST